MTPVPTWASQRAEFLGLAHATVQEARQAATSAGEGQATWELLRMAAEVEIALLNLGETEAW